MVAAMSQLPTILRRTLTYDQGSEMANHAQIAAATDLDRPALDALVGRVR